MVREIILWKNIILISEVQEAIRQKVVEHQDLMNKLTEALSKQEGRTITCKTYIEKIEHIDTANFS